MRAGTTRATDPLCLPYFSFFGLLQRATKSVRAMCASIEALLQNAQPRILSSRVLRFFRCRGTLRNFSLLRHLLYVRITDTYRFRLRWAPFSGLQWPFSAIFHFIFALINKCIHAVFIIKIVELLLGSCNYVRLFNCLLLSFSLIFIRSSTDSRCLS